MKSSVKPFIFYSISVISLFALLVIAFVGIKKMNDDLIRNRELINTKITILENEKVIQTAFYQQLTNEEIITEIAVNELKLIKNNDPLPFVEIEKIRVEKINSILKNKYE